MRYMFLILFCVSYVCAMKRDAPKDVLPMGLLDQGFFLLSFANNSKDVKQYKQWMAIQDNTISIKIINCISRPLIVGGFADEIFEKIDNVYYKQLKPSHFAGQTFVVQIDNYTQATAVIKNGHVEDTVLCTTILNDFDTINKMLNNIELSIQR